MALKAAVALLPQDYSKQPASLHADGFAAKSKEIRLHSLQSDPTAFSSNYAQEMAFDDSVWVSRLQNRLGRTIISLDISGEDVENGIDATSNLDLIARAPWIGTTVLLGPRLFLGELPESTEPGEQMFRMADEISRDDAGEWIVDTDRKEHVGKPASFLYVLNAVYVLPSGRGKGTGTKLMDFALNAIKNDRCRSKEGADFFGTKVCLVHVKKENTRAKKMYEAKGFRQIGERDYISSEGKPGGVIFLRFDVV